MSPRRQLSSPEFAAEVTELVRAYVNSEPPPAHAQNARDELVRRASTSDSGDTGRFFVDDFEKGLRASYERAALETVRERLHDEQRQRDHDRIALEAEKQKNEALTKSLEARTETAKTESDRKFQVRLQILVFVLALINVIIGAIFAVKILGAK